MEQNVYSFPNGIGVMYPLTLFGHLTSRRSLFPSMPSDASDVCDIACSRTFSQLICQGCDGLLLTIPIVGHWFDTVWVDAN